MDVRIIFIALIIKLCARVQLLVSTLWTSFTKGLTTLASTTMHSSGEVVVATIRFFNFDYGNIVDQISIPTITDLADYDQNSGGIGGGLVLSVLLDPYCAGYKQEQEVKILVNFG